MMPHSWREQKIDVAEQNLRGIVPDAILVRLSSVAPDGDAARHQIDEFVRAMIEFCARKDAVGLYRLRMRFRSRDGA